jgi:shikimate kinase
MRIFLTGFMGSGKSTVGPLVADQLGFRFIDLDERVEAAAGRSAAEVLQERGEPRFRALETAVLSQVLSEEDVVIATGGGALASDATMAMAKDGGMVVYLRVRPETLAQRLQSDATRPLLHDSEGHGMRGKELLERINEILADRRRFYEQADAIVEADEMTPPDVALAAVRAAVAHGAAAS